jgi:ketosteroid isomerase-like protein
MSNESAADRDIGGIFAAIDTFDTSGFLGFLTEDAVFRFGSAPAVEGKAAIGEAVNGFFSTIAGCSHRVDKTLSDSDTLVCEGEVTYQRHDGTKITVPFTDIFEYENDRISRYKIYIDIAPLYAE